ncbi:MAG: heme o synthase [Pseudobdellovibrionaceae bacterium]
MLKAYSDFTKFGIVIFAILTGLAGYALGFQIETPFSFSQFLSMLFGMYFLSSGSLALNQVQEREIDMKMKRTANRPLVTGKITPGLGLWLSVVLLLLGHVLLYWAAPLSMLIGFITVVLYNGLYTYWWKPKMVFGAVPGALPGSLPVTIGFSAANPNIFGSDSIYLFLVLFVWQMPHFWTLAIKYKDDYAAGGIPVLPSVMGTERTLFHIGLYTFLYVGLALAAPMFVYASWIYLAFVVPVAIKVMWEFIKFFKAKGEQHWLSFFLWTNLSMLIFLFVPVIDKWNFLFIGTN